MNADPRTGYGTARPCGCAAGTHATPATRPCDCSCAQCQPGSCELECLVHPRFYCGQLLTDRDLSQLVDWIKAKSALVRYRAGWGVVCGLEVRSTDGVGVVVAPGYAITCCGNDVVVCDETRIDLAAWCPKTPCAGSEPPLDETAFRVGTFAASSHQIVALDLYLQVDEKLSDPQPARTRGTCGTTTTCEYGRVEESFRLCPVPVDPCAIDEPSGWQAQYVEHVGIITAALVPGQVSRQAMLDWLGRHPPRFALSLVPEVTEAAEDLLPVLRLRILEDWIRTFFARSCAGCHESRGVRLARVVLGRRRADATGSADTTCRVLRIDPFPPYRRPLAVDGTPVTAEGVTLGHLIGAEVDHARAALVRLGLDASVQPLVAGDDAALARAPSIALDERRVTLHVLADDCGRPRVVAIGPNAAVHPGEDTGVEPAGDGVVVGPENP